MESKTWFGLPVRPSFCQAVFSKAKKSITGFLVLIRWPLMVQAMPKFQSEMQFKSYLPVCSTTKDLPASESSRAWLQNSKDRIQINGDGCNTLCSPCKISQLQDHEKEMIKKIMLQHETLFKHQVNELHRFYRR